MPGEADAAHHPVHQECRPRQQIDIRVEHQRQHQDSAAKRSDFGEPVVARAPTGQIAQGRLYDAGMIQEIMEDEQEPQERLLQFMGHVTEKALLPLNQG